MADERVIMMSSQGYKDLVNPADGKGLYWTSDINVELPIKVRQSGPGSERPFTLCELFKNTVEGGGDRPAMYVERGGKYNYQSIICLSLDRREFNSVDFSWS